MKPSSSASWKRLRQCLFALGSFPFVKLGGVYLENGAEIKGQIHPRAHGDLGE